MAIIRSRIAYTEREISRLKEYVKKDKEWLKQLEKEAQKTTNTGGSSPMSQKTGSTETKKTSTNAPLKDVKPIAESMSPDEYTSEDQV